MTDEKFTVTLRRQFSFSEWDAAWRDASWRNVEAGEGMPTATDAGRCAMQTATGVRPSRIDKVYSYFTIVATWRFNNVTDAMLFKLRWGG